MKKLQKYTFYGGMFGVALATAVFAGLSDEAGIISEAFFVQEQANASTALVPQVYQQLSCEDITHDIVATDVVLSDGSVFSGVDLVLSFGQVSGKGDWGDVRKRTFASSLPTTVTSSDRATVRFNFASPIAADALCQNAEDVVYLTLSSADGDAGSVRVHGGTDSTAYRGPLYNCVLENGLPCLGDVHDLAFALRTSVNTAPVIDPQNDRKVQELETLTITLTATDPDGDTITWGSSYLPDNATLDETTGVFTFIPSSEQIGGYEIVFTATDDGGPVEQSSSIQVTITVIDVDTPTDQNETIEEILTTYDLPTAVLNSYSANLKNVDTFIQKGQIKAAINQLNVLQKKLDADLKQETITNVQYKEVSAKIAALQTDLQPLLDEEK